MKLKKMWFQVMMMCIAFNLFVSNVKAEPIYDPSSQMVNIYSDQTALHVGDILTVRVLETLTNKRDDEFKTAKNFNVGSPTGTGFLHFIDSALSGSGTSTSSSSRQISANDALVTTFSVRVVRVDSNGNLFVSGSHEVTVDNEKRLVTLSGTVRSRDVDSTNGVNSSQVADMVVDVRGMGKSPGIFAKILRVLF